MKEETLHWHHRNTRPLWTKYANKLDKLEEMDKF